MADIVRLEENGVTQFIETHLKAIQGIDFQKVAVTYAKGFRPYPNTSGLEVVSLGGIFSTISGSFTNDADIAVSAEVVIGSIPAEFAPPSTYHLLSQGSGSAIFLLSVLTDGKLQLSRYRAGSAIVCPKGSWLTPSSGIFPNKSNRR